MLIKGSLFDKIDGLAINKTKELCLKRAMELSPSLLLAAWMMDGWTAEVMKIKGKQNALYQNKRSFPKLAVACDSPTQLRQYQVLAQGIIEGSIHKQKSLVRRVYIQRKTRKNRQGVKVLKVPFIEVCLSNACSVRWSHAYGAR